ncbi:protein jagged-1-like, partial [Ruditapes philippinarum]|uniref:protein jagged-1-like n=1 Tax=Ruditapes philippinarum TaxID=129788 RepID=UPI00295B5821
MKIAVPVIVNVTVEDSGLNGLFVVKVTMRLTWGFAHATCSDTAISSGAWMGDSASISCSGCTSSYLGAYRIRCQDFMTGSWSSGENSFTLNTTTTKQFTFWFSSGTWFALQSGGGFWNLNSTVDLATRQDTGGINSSPTVNMPSVIYWQTGCSYTYTLPVNDVDGDVIRCRWANGSTECADVCQAFSEASLNEATCTISYTAGTATGFYAVAIQVEDFITTTSTTPLSSIPLQFMINIYSGSGCSDAPQFIDPTPTVNTKLVTDIGNQYSFTIKVQGPHAFLRLVILSEIGISQSSTTFLVSTVYVMTVTATWTSTIADADLDHRVCYYARDTIGVTSESRCIILHATDTNKCVSDPCQNNGTCNNILKSYTCSCQPGYEGVNCELDIDECAAKSNLCEHTCLNVDGSYECLCNIGYRTRSTNNSLCNDINECDESIHNCSQLCENVNGGFQCSCFTGFTFNNVTWNCDKDVKTTCTETKIINCSHTAGCTVDEISLNETCFCENGFELSTDGTACIDIDECERNICPQRCVNTFGGFKCLCYSGFKLQEDLSCKECEFPFWGDGCLNECKCSERGATDCNPVRGCICKDGWHGDKCD